MRRQFDNSNLQHVYDALYDTRPDRESDANATAFFIGYERPDMQPNTALCGEEFSESRAAWLAGVDSRRDDDDWDSKQLNGPPVQIVF